MAHLVVDVSKTDIYKSLAKDHIANQRSRESWLRRDDIKIISQRSFAEDKR